QLRRELGAAPRPVRLTAVRRHAHSFRCWAESCVNRALRHGSRQPTLSYLFLHLTRSLGSDIGEPTVRVLADALDQIEEALLNLRRDWPAPAVADLNAVDASHRRDLRRRAGEKDLVGHVHYLPRQLLLDHR